MAPPLISGVRADEAWIARANLGIRKVKLSQIKIVYLSWIQKFRARLI